MMKQFLAGIFLAGLLLQAAQVFAQTKQEEEGTIRIRIEKQKDGKTEIIEKTYPADEWPGHIPEAMFFNFSDSFKDFGDNFHMRFDSVFSGFTMPGIPEMSFKFNDKDGQLFQNELFWHNNIDSVLEKHEQMMFQFNHTMKPSLDSMLNKGMEGMKNFQFNWPGDFDGKGLNLMLDKDQYNVEETEDAQGNKMIRITPKAGNDWPAKKSGNRMQPSSTQLNLSYNPLNKQLIVGFDLSEQENVAVSVINPAGKEVFKDYLKKFTGAYRKEIRVKGSGVFSVKVTYNNSVLQEKITVE